ncbi:hypothetical protein [Thermocoleostomius sinensis]|uniref:Chromosome segregation ATPase n=1 Tax=Thermocoleostomius sinensis A174 TaxID=2016057 RepID=A0A9E8ZFL1_9CYAN|nr:hypothetical protein [Thermocoleostomius sinensis]WAL60882.1 hypothetical protein OXH18_02475 [Thermocoleostomius sinensis A174]
MQPSLPSNATHSVENSTRRWKKLVLWSSASVATIVVSFGGYTVVQWFATGADRTSLEYAITLQQQGRFQACINQAQLVSSASPLHDQAEAVRQACQLSQANTLAQQNNLTEAVKLLGGISSDRSLNPRVQTALDDWSKLLIDRATAEYDMGNRDAAIVMLRTIPASSSMHSEAAATMSKWAEEWTANANHIQKIRQVLQVNDLKGAFAELQKITTLYWTQQAHTIILDKITEIIAYEQSVAAANAEKLAIAEQLRAEAERLLAKAKAKADAHYAKSYAPPKPHHWQPILHWTPIPWVRKWLPPVPIVYPRPPVFHPGDLTDPSAGSSPAPSNPVPIDFPAEVGIPSDEGTVADEPTSPDEATPGESGPSDVISSPDAETSSETPSDELTPDVDEPIATPDAISPVDDLPLPDVTLPEDPAPPDDPVVPVVPDAIDPAEIPPPEPADVFIPDPIPPDIAPPPDSFPEAPLTDPVFDPVVEDVAVPDLADPIPLPEPEPTTLDVPLDAFTN